MIAVIIVTVGLALRYGGTDAEFDDEGRVRAAIPVTAPSRASHLHTPKSDASGCPAGFAAARAVADAVLYEGYLLYPYRRSSGKNRVRWQFGVLAPRSWIEAGGPAAPTVAGAADAWQQRTECLLEADAGRPGLRAVAVPAAPAPVRAGRHGPGGRRAGGRRRQPPDVRRGACRVRSTSPSTSPPCTATRTSPRSSSPAARRRRRCRTGRDGWSARARRSRPSCARRRRTPRPRSSCTSCVWRSRTPSRTWPPTRPGPTRCAAPSSPRTRCWACAAGQFLSLLDPPAWAAHAAGACVNLHTFPVLAGGDDGPAGVVLSSPIILYDHPRVAPESPGDLFDAGEIDEILTLRTLTLTDEEKREARATDARAAEIIDRVGRDPAGGARPAARRGAVAHSGRSEAGRPRPAPDPVVAAADDGVGPPPLPVPSTPWWDPGADASVSPETDAVLVDGVRVAQGYPGAPAPAGPADRRAGHVPRRPARRASRPCCSTSTGPRTSR